MATLLNAVTADTTSTATSFANPPTLYVDGDLGGREGHVHVLTASTEGGVYRKVWTFRENTVKRYVVNGTGTQWIKVQFVEGSTGSSGLTVTTTETA